MKLSIIRSRRRTISIQVNPDMTVIVRAPLRASDRVINKFIKEKEDWIYKQLDKLAKQQKEINERGIEKLSNEDIKSLAKRAVEYIPERVSYYAEIMGVTYGRITIRNQRTRWGSCSSKGNLNFNCLLMLAPRDIIDYVVVHELSHRKEMNHSRAFWNEVGKVIPDYKEKVKWLKNEGEFIMARMP